MASSVNNDASALFNQLNSVRTGSTANSDSSVSGAQTDFLNLLTTQLQNQDPLNPMDNAQMTSQLAQINTVDGINKLNATLTAMMNNSMTQQALQAAALVGHGALVAGSNMALTTSTASDGTTSSAAIGGFNLASNADIVTIKVSDASGNVVRTISLQNQDAGTQNFVWDGKDDNGNAEPAGNYTFSVSATQGTNKVTADPLQFGYISGVTLGSSGTIGVDVGSYGRFNLGDIQQII